MKAEQDALRGQIRATLEARGMTPSRLAKEAGLAHTTLTRFLNNPDVTHTLSTTTLAKLRRAAGSLPASEGVAEPALAAPKEDNGLLRDVGSRMRLVRTAVYSEISDEAVAAAMGWSLSQMEAMFDGRGALTLAALRTFALRTGVTMDFLILGSLDGLHPTREQQLREVEPSLEAASSYIRQGTGRVRA